VSAPGDDAFFFDQDGDGHWYMVPAAMKGVWASATLSDVDPEDYEAQERFEETFGGHRLVGPVSDVLFIPVGR
jgi:hypothetical protein